MPSPLLDPEAAHRTVDAFNRLHGLMLRDNEAFKVSARLQDGSVVVTLVLERRDQTFRYVMECAKSVPEDGTLTVGDTFDLCRDFLGWYLGEYFESERDLILPLDWKSHRFGEIEVLARGDVRKPALDEAADAWLRGERPDIS